MKKQYIVVHDYGMGGVWAVVSARSEQEISKKYPDLEIVKARPAWMSDAIYKKLLSIDIDDEPRGWLAKLGER